MELRSSIIMVDESMLTGESENVTKHTDMVDLPGEIVNQDKLNMLFSGTLITRGTARGTRACYTGPTT